MEKQSRKSFCRRPTKLNLAEGFGFPEDDKLIYAFAEMNDLEYFPENEVIAFIGGYEMTVKEVRALRNWCSKALDFSQEYLMTKAQVHIEGPLKMELQER